MQADSPKELEAILGQDTHVNRPWERFFVQEKIAGSVYCVAMVMNHGVLKGHVVYRQLRDYPFSGGQATLRVSVDHPEAVVHFERLLRELRWHGVCQADFLVAEKTGIPYLIDINPRFWGSLMQGVASGVDFPYLLYRIASDGDVEACSRIQDRYYDTVDMGGPEDTAPGFTTVQQQDRFPQRVPAALRSPNDL